MSSNASQDKPVDDSADKPLSDVVAEVLRQFQQTGTVRQSDLRRLLGSQSENDKLRQAVLDALREAQQKK